MAKKTRKKPLPKAKRLAREKAIVSDIQAGELSYRDIAKKHSVSLPTVSNKARKFGVGRRSAKTARPANVSHRATNASFAEDLRQLFLAHRPDTTLAKFERIAKSMHAVLEDSA